MSELDAEIQAYQQMRADLEAKHMGQWVVVHDGQLIGAYPFFENAAEDAVQRFGRGPYLIRQVGVNKITLPASVMYRSGLT